MTDPHRTEADTGDSEGANGGRTSGAVAMEIDGVLDLHTFSPRDVPGLVPAYLDECQRAGVLAVRIIHGKGKGVLRRTVHAILERREDVSSFALAEPHRGGWGATTVTLNPAVPD